MSSFVYYGEGLYESHAINKVLGQQNLKFLITDGNYWSIYDDTVMALLEEISWTGSGTGKFHDEDRDAYHAPDVPSASITEPLGTEPQRQTQMVEEIKESERQILGRNNVPSGKPPQLPQKKHDDPLSGSTKEGKNQTAVSILPEAVQWSVAPNNLVQRRALETPYSHRKIIMKDIQYIGPKVSLPDPALSRSSFFSGNWGTQIIPSGIVMIEGMRQGSLFDSVTKTDFEAVSSYRKKYDIGPEKSALTIFLNSYYSKIHVQIIGTPIQTAFLIIERKAVELFTLRPGDEIMRHCAPQYEDHDVKDGYKLVIVPAELAKYLRRYKFSIGDDPKAIIDKLTEVYKENIKDGSTPIILAIQLHLSD